MSQMWHRNRGLANPVPAVEPGGVEQAEWDPGGDVILPDDHFSRLHNPQNGRVPPQLPAAVTRPQYPDFPLRQYSRFFDNTPAPAGSNVLRNEQLGFTAHAVRLDNYSSHWIYIPSVGMYVPPFVYGSVFLLDPGTNVANIQIQPPRGHVDGTALESLVVSIWYEAPHETSVGIAGPNT